MEPRLVVAALAIVLAGIAKGVTGMGLPVVGVPILVALYGDLRLVLPVTVVATTLSDAIMVVKWRHPVRELTVILPFAVAGLIGIVAGTHLLVILNPAILSGLLAAVVIVFIVVSWLNKIPALDPRAARRWGAPIGLLGGISQGAAGASGPIVASYLLSIGLTRATFLFAINVIFLILDATQFVSLARLDVFRPERAPAAAAVCVLMVAGMAAGFALQPRIHDRLFRRAVLVLLAVVALGLIVRTATAFAHR